MLPQEFIEINVSRQETLQENVNFRYAAYRNETKSFEKGYIATANYQAVIDVNFALPQKDSAFFKQLAHAQNVLSSMFILYGDKLLDEKFLNKQLKKLLPEASCSLVRVERNYQTSIRTGRGGSFDFATDPETLIGENETENY